MWNYAVLTKVVAKIGGPGVLLASSVALPLATLAVGVFVGYKIGKSRGQNGREEV